MLQTEMKTRVLNEYKIGLCLACLRDSKEIKVVSECGSTRERIGRGRGQKG